MAVGTPERVVDEIVRQNKRDRNATPFSIVPRKGLSRYSERCVPCPGQCALPQ
jgi:hypothetical protein